jgi:hypothetical protein
MEHVADTLEWPMAGNVRIARGRYYNETLANREFWAIRLLDRRSGRYYYDLYFKDELFLTRVNPLFLEFIDLY